MQLNSRLAEQAVITYTHIVTIPSGSKEIWETINSIATNQQRIISTELVYSPSQAGGTDTYYLIIGGNVPHIIINTEQYGRIGVVLDSAVSSAKNVMMRLYCIQ